MHSFNNHDAPQRAVLKFDSNFTQQDLQLLADILTRANQNVDIEFHLDSMGNIDGPTLNTLLALKAVYRLHGGNLKFFGGNSKTQRLLDL